MKELPWRKPPCFDYAFALPLYRTAAGINVGISRALNAAKIDPPLTDYEEGYEACLKDVKKALDTLDSGFKFNMKKPSKDFSGKYFYGLAKD